MDEGELKQLFYKIWDESFSDYAPQTKLIIENLVKKAGADSSPFVDSIRINLELFLKYKKYKRFENLRTKWNKSRLPI